MSRQALFTGLVILSIFLAGALSGAAVVRVLSGPEVAVAEGDGPDGPRVRMRGDGGPEEGPEEGDERGRPYAFADFLEEELDLTPAQRAEVEAILVRREEEARQIFRESRNRFRLHLEDTMEEVENALPEEAASEFRRLIEEMERRFRRDDGPPPGDRGDPGPEIR